MPATELTDEQVFGKTELTDEQVFGAKELSDEEVFGNRTDTKKPVGLNRTIPAWEGAGESISGPAPILSDVEKITAINPVDPKKLAATEQRAEAGDIINRQADASKNGSNNPAIESWRLEALKEIGTTPATDSDLEKPLIKIPTVSKSDLKTLGLPDKIAGMSAGVQQGITGAVQFLTTPLGLATLGSGSLSKATQQAVATAFAVDMARHAPEQFAAIGTALGEGDEEKAARSIVEAASTIYFVKKSAEHGLPEIANADPMAMQAKPLDKAAIEKSAIQGGDPIRLTVAKLESSDAPLTAEALKAAMEGNRLKEEPTTKLVENSSKLVVEEKPETVAKSVAAKPFEVDDQLVMRSPHTGDDTIVSYRGKPKEGHAVIWTGKTQFQVPENWLRRQGEKYEGQIPTVPKAEVVAQVEKTQPKVAEVREELLPPERLSKTELAKELAGEKPSNYPGASEWEKSHKRFLSHSKEELVSKVLNERKSNENFKNLQAKTSELFPELEKIANEAGLKWRDALKQRAKQDGVEAYLPPDGTKGDAVYALANRIASKKLSPPPNIPSSALPTVSVEGATKGKTTPASETPAAGIGEVAEKRQADISEKIEEGDDAKVKLAGRDETVTVYKIVGDTGYFDHFGIKSRPLSELTLHKKSPRNVRKAEIEKERIESDAKAKADFENQKTEIPKLTGKTKGVEIKVQNPYGLAPEGEKIQTVKGDVIKLTGAPKLDFFVYKKGKGWRVVEKNSGLGLGDSYGKTRREAIEKSEKALGIVGEARAHQAVDNSEWLNGVNPNKASIDKAHIESVRKTVVENLEKSKPVPVAEAPRPKKENSPDAEYDSAKENFRKASRDFTKVREGFRAKEISDVDFFKGKADFDKAQKDFDAAETKYIEDKNAEVEKPVEKPAEELGDLFPDIKSKAPTLERVRRAIEEAEADLEEKIKATEADDVPLDSPLHDAAEKAQKRVDELRALGFKLEEKALPDGIVGMGGAVPSEFGKPGDYVSNMFAAIDADRAAMGKEPMAETKKRSWDEDNQKALAKMNRDPHWIPNLLAEVGANPRPLLSWENAGVVWHRAKLKAEANNALQRVAQAFDDGRLEDLAQAKVDAEIFENQIDALDKIVGANGTGSEAGRSLNAQKMAAAEDFSLVEMRLKKRASANNGAPLTEAQSKEVEKLHAEIEKTTREFRESEAKKDERIANLEVERALLEAKNQARKEPVVEPHVRIIADKVKAYFDNRANAALKRLQGKSFTLSPEVLADLTDLGVSKVLSGSIEFAEWSVKMAEALGEKIKPHLQTAWESSQNALDKHVEKMAGGKATQVKRAVRKLDIAEKTQAAKDSIKEKLDSGEKPEAVPFLGNLARLFVEQGINTRDALIDAIHEVLVEIDPEITRRETMDAISGYGDFRQLTKDEISLKLRDLKGQMQQVAKLEDMQNGQPPLKTGMERRTPSVEESRLIKLVNEAKQEFQIPITDEATQLKSSLDTLKSRLKSKTAELEGKLERKDFAKKERRIMKMDAEANRLHYKMTEAKLKWHEALMQDRLANRSVWGKALGAVGEVLNTSRAILTSLDLSAVLRQGGFIALGHPIRAAQSFPAMFRALMSPEKQHAVKQEILKRPNYPLYQRSKLYLSEHGDALSKMEEAYMSRWAQKIPLVAASQRAYTTFLDKLRADSFDAMAETLARSKELTPAEANAIANYVNVSTGRGAVGEGGKGASALVGLNTAFFAPRYVASRFQMLLGQPMYRGTARTRGLVAKEYARFLTGLAVIYGLAQLDDESSVELDPRSSDFGKIRFGNTRIDPMAGLSQSTVLLSRLASGETMKANGKIVPINGDKVPFGGDDTVRVLAKFLRSKLAPAPGNVLSLHRGQDVVGNEFGGEELAENMLVPLALSDIYQTMQEQGVPRGTALSILSIFGMGLQAYDERKK